MEIFKNKTVLITGANRGIGRSFLKSLLNTDVKKIYATGRNIETLSKFKDSRIVPLKLDITDHNQIKEVATYASDVNILINNAGILSPGNILDGDIKAMEQDLEVNYFGTIHMMRAFASVLEKNRPSRIVNIVSIVAYSPLASIAGYSASKAALYSCTLSARTELAHKGVKVHAVNPGAIDTDMNKGSNWDMPSPDNVVNTILNKINEEELDIIPDEMGQNMYNLWKEAPTKLSELFSNMYHEG